jgi:hypothetical protein
MPVVEDELWKNPGNPGMIVVTSHASVKKDGRLFLVDGLELEAAKRIPNIDLQCGNLVLAHAVDNVYGFIPIRPSHPEKRIVGFGIFQAKKQWNEPANPELIKYSMECLRQYAAENSNLKIRMNFPGIGQGGLTVEEVAPLLLPLPPTVTVCHRGEIQPSTPPYFQGFKTIYLQVESMLREGRSQQAVEYMIRNGFDIQSALEQVQAVERLLRERHQKEADHIRRWRSAHKSQP